MNRMVRCAALLLLVACDAGVPTQKPHQLTRAEYDAVLAEPLPLHGFAVKTFGRPEYRDVELVDLDAETLRVVGNTAWQHVDQTLPLAESDLKTLVDLSDLALREKPVPVPQDAALRESLVMAAGDNVFEVSGDLIGAGISVRPAASGLVRTVLDLARGTLAQLAPPPLPPPPPPPPPKHMHSIARSSLPTADTPTRLPLHGVVVHSWGLGGDETVVVNSDKTTVRVLANLMGKPPRDDTYKGDAKQIEQIMMLAVAAWNEDGSEMPTATDVREDLYVLDGDEAFFLSGHPIAANGKTGRPAAVKAVDAVFRAVR
jgi:hypothetical protein